MGIRDCLKWGRGREADGAGKEAVEITMRFRISRKSGEGRGFDFGWVVIILRGRK